MTTATFPTVTLPRVQAFASADQVRAWAKANDIEVSAAGRLSPELVSAYNAKNGLKYVSGKHVDLVTVEGRKNGKKVTRKADVAAVRAALSEAGVTVPSRGRISYALMLSALGLEPVNPPVEKVKKERKPAAEKVVKTVVFRGNAVPVTEAREALKREGFPVGDRGRIPAEFLTSKPRKVVIVED